MKGFTSFFGLPSFFRDWQTHKLTDQDLLRLYAVIAENPESGKHLKDIEGVRAMKFLPPSAPQHEVRIYFGFATRDQVVLLAIVLRAEAKKLPPADRARIRRRFIALKTAMAGPTEVREINVVPAGEYDGLAIQRLRRDVGVSQAVFADLMGVSKMLVQGWEQGVRGATPLARRLLDVINDDPDRFLKRWTVSVKKEQSS